MEIKKELKVNFSEKELFAIEVISELVGEMLEYSFDNHEDFSDFTYEDLDTTYSTLCDLLTYGREK